MSSGKMNLSIFLFFTVFAFFLFSMDVSAQQEDDRIKIKTKGDQTTQAFEKGIRGTVGKGADGVDKGLAVGEKLLGMQDAATEALKNARRNYLALEKSGKATAAEKANAFDRYLYYKKEAGEEITEQEKKYFNALQGKAKQEPGLPPRSQPTLPPPPPDYGSPEVKARVLARWEELKRIEKWMLDPIDKKIQELRIKRQPYDDLETVYYRKRKEFQALYGAEQAKITSILMFFPSSLDSDKRYLEELMGWKKAETPKSPLPPPVPQPGPLPAEVKKLTKGDARFAFGIICRSDELMFLLQTKRDEMKKTPSRDLEKLYKKYRKINDYLIKVREKAMEVVIGYIAQRMGGSGPLDSAKNASALKKLWNEIFWKSSLEYMAGDAQRLRVSTEPKGVDTGIPELDSRLGKILAAGGTLDEKTIRGEIEAAAEQTRATSGSTISPTQFNEIIGRIENEIAKTRPPEGETGVIPPVQPPVQVPLPKPPRPKPIRVEKNVTTQTGMYDTRITKVEERRHMPDGTYESTEIIETRRADGTLVSTYTGEWKNNRSIPVGSVTRNYSGAQSMVIVVAHTEDGKSAKAITQNLDAQSNPTSAPQVQYTGNYPKEGTEGSVLPGRILTRQVPTGRTITREVPTGRTIKKEVPVRTHVREVRTGKMLERVVPTGNMLTRRVPTGKILTVQIKERRLTMSSADRPFANYEVDLSSNDWKGFPLARLGKEEPPPPAEKQLIDFLSRKPAGAKIQVVWDGATQTLREKRPGEKLTAGTKLRPGLKEIVTGSRQEPEYRTEQYQETRIEQYPETRMETYTETRTEEIPEMRTESIPEVLTETYVEGLDLTQGPPERPGREPLVRPPGRPAPDPGQGLPPERPGREPLVRPPGRPSSGGGIEGLPPERPGREPLVRPPGRPGSTQPGGDVVQMPDGSRIETTFNDAANTMTEKVSRPDGSWQSSSMSLTGAAPGILQAIYRNDKNLFQRIKNESKGGGNLSPETSDLINRFGRAPGPTQGTLPPKPTATTGWVRALYAANPVLAMKAITELMGKGRLSSETRREGQSVLGRQGLNLESLSDKQLLLSAITEIRADNQLRGIASTALLAGKMAARRPQDKALVGAIEAAINAQGSMENVSQALDGVLGGGFALRERVAGLVQSIPKTGGLDTKERGIMGQNERGIMGQNEVPKLDQNLARLAQLRQGGKVDIANYTVGAYAGKPWRYTYGKKDAQGNILEVTKSDIEYGKDKNGRAVEKAYGELIKDSSGQEVGTVNRAYDEKNGVVQERDYKEIATLKDKQTDGLVRTLSVVKAGEETAKALIALDAQGNEKTFDAKAVKDKAALAALRELNQAGEEEQGAKAASPGSMKKIAMKKFKEGMVKLEQEFAKIDATRQDSALRQEKLVDEGQRLRDMMKAQTMENLSKERSTKEGVPSQRERRQ